MANEHSSFLTPAKEELPVSGNGEENEEVNWYILGFKYGYIDFPELDAFLSSLIITETMKNKLIEKACEPLTISEIENEMRWLESDLSAAREKWISFEKLKPKKKFRSK